MGETPLHYEINKHKVVFRIIAGEAVMLNLDNGYYYSLDETGTQIWKAIDEHKSLSEICSGLLEEYEVCEHKLKADVLKFITRLEKAELIHKA